MKRNKRLNRSDDIQNVRRSGKSFSHPLMVLIVLSEIDEEGTKIGVIATKSVGGAVARNRAKRLLRAGVEPYCDRIKPAYKLVLIGRKPIVAAEPDAISQAIQTLFTKAGILMN